MKKMLPLLVLTFLAVFATAKTAFASVLYITPSSGQVASGSTLAISIKLDTQSEPTNAVSAYLAYPQGKFDIAYINSGGSAFGITAEEVGGGGTIKLSRGNIAAVNGNVLVANVGLRAKTLGDATVYFIGGSHIPRYSDNGDSLNLGASKGGTFTVVAPAPASASAPVKPKDITPPQIANISISDIATNSATVNWKTDKNADSFVEFGLDKGKYIASVSDSKLTKNHSLKITGELLQSGLKIFYRIHSKDDSSNEVVSAEGVIQLKGYQVTLKILDDRNNPLKNVEVLLFSDPLKGTTNDRGEVTFQDVTSGKHQVVVRFKDQETQTEITVADSSQLQTIPVSVKLKSTPVLPSLKLNPLTIIALFIIVITVAMLIYLLLKNRKNLKEAESYFNPMSPMQSDKPTNQPPHPTNNTNSEENPVVVYREK